MAKAWRWVSFDSVKDHSLCEGKVPGLSLTCCKCYLDIGTMTTESVPHPLHKLQ